MRTETNKGMTMNSQINQLRPGQQTQPIVTAFVSTWVERSGDGKTLRFVRQVGNTTTVYLTRTF